MNRAPKLFIGFFIIAVCSNCFSRGWADALISLDEALKQIYKNAQDFHKKTIVLTSQQIRQIETGAAITFEGSHADTVKVYVAYENGKPAGYAFEDTVIGKWGPIHYLLGLDPQGTVLDTIILDYQEIRGKPIAKKRFLRQYKGKTSRHAVQLQKDIDGVTGATISSRSLTDGIRKILHTYHLIQPALVQ